MARFSSESVGQLGLAGFESLRHSGVVVSALASINEVNQRRAGLVSTEVGDRIRVQFPVRGIYLGM